MERIADSDVTSGPGRSGEGETLTRESAACREHHERLAAERARQLLAFARTEWLFTSLLLASTLFAWENFPRIIPGPAQPGQFVGGGDVVGVRTLPAGPLVIGLALLTLAWSSRLRSGRPLVGGLSLGRGLIVLGVVVTEIVQLLLGRRNWEDHHTTISNPALANSVGTGVWLALAAAIALVVLSLIYLWRAYHFWGDVTTPH
jgi:hypothetical protein